MPTQIYYLLPTNPNLLIIRHSKHLGNPNFTLYGGILTIKLLYSKIFFLDVTVMAYLISLNHV